MTKNISADSYSAMTKLQLLKLANEGEEKELFKDATKEELVEYLVALDKRAAKSGKAKKPAAAEGSSETSDDVTRKVSSILMIITSALFLLTLLSLNGQNYFGHTLVNLAGGSPFIATYVLMLGGSLVSIGALTFAIINIASSELRKKMGNIAFILTIVLLVINVILIIFMISTWSTVVLGSLITLGLSIASLVIFKKESN